MGRHSVCSPSQDVPFNLFFNQPKHAWLFDCGGINPQGWSSQDFQQGIEWKYSAPSYFCEYINALGENALKAVGVCWQTGWKTQNEVRWRKSLLVLIQSSWRRKHTEPKLRYEPWFVRLLMCSEVHLTADVNLFPKKKHITIFQLLTTMNRTWISSVMCPWKHTRLTGLLARERSVWVAGVSRFRCWLLAALSSPPGWLCWRIPDGLSTQFNPLWVNNTRRAITAACGIRDNQINNSA